jgi:hypothetical protein
MISVKITNFHTQADKINKTNMRFYAFKKIFFGIKANSKMITPTNFLFLKDLNFKRIYGHN